MDKLIKSGTNKNGVKWEVYKDTSCGDHYLIIDGQNMPSHTGSLKSCESLALDWVE